MSEAKGNYYRPGFAPSSKIASRTSAGDIAMNLVKHEGPSFDSLLPSLPDSSVQCDLPPHIRSTCLLNIGTSCDPCPR